MSLTTPDFLIIGAPKCGTTSLSNALSRHPEIYIPPIKEVGFFSNDKNWQKGREWYASYFEDAEPDMVVGEASPQYLRAPDAPECINCVCPGARFIALVRDPVERARSHYWFRRWGGTESRPLREAFEEELDRFPNWKEEDYLLPPGFYAEHLDRYVQCFGRDRLLVISLSRLSSSPQDVLSNVQRFLGVSVCSLKLDRNNPSSAPRSQVYRDFVQYLVKSQGIVKSLVKSVATYSTRRRIRKTLHSLNVKEKEKPPLPEGIRKSLISIYYKNMIKMEDKFGVKLD